jgi:hypothetical protein
MRNSFYTFDDAQLQSTANNVKDAVIIALVTQKLLMEEQGIELRDKYGMIVIQQGWFSKFVDKTFGLTRDKDGMVSLVYRLVKLVD